MQTHERIRLVVHAAGALLLALPVAVSGQTGAAPSALECTQLALAEISAAQPAAAARRGSDESLLPRDFKCWIEYTDAAAWSGGQPTWVDVRSPAQTRSMKLGGVLEIPLTDLPHKTFLRDRPIVVIGTGFDEVELANACAELQKNGFSQVKLLRGGVRAWQQAGQPLATGSAAIAMDAIAPGEFHRSVAGAPWLLLGFGVAGDEVLPGKFDRLQRIDSGGDPSRALAAIAQARTELARVPAATRPTLIVVVTPDAASARQLQEAGRRARLQDVLFLVGGLAGYRTFIAEQESMAANAGKPLVRPCGSG